MKLIARLMAVLYLVMVIFVVFHQFGFQINLLENPRPLVFVAMGILSFIVLGKIINEVTNTPPSNEDHE